MEEIWKVKGEGTQVKEIWEDFFGNLWFTTEIQKDNFRFGYVRLYNMPDCAEWGCFNLDEIKEAVGKNKLWQVPTKDWENINSYEEDLLIKIDK